MAKQHRLDIDLGESLLAWLEEQAAISGESKGAIARALIQEGRMAQAEYADTIRRSVLRLAEAVQPDERFDPADDPRAPLATESLGRLLGSPYAAQGIAEALRDLWTAWRLESRDLTEARDG